MVNVELYGVPKRYADATFAGVSDPKIAEVCKQFADGGVDNLALKGVSGTGKTYVSCAIVTYLLNTRKIHSYRAETQTLITEYQAGSKWKVPEKYLQTKVLVLENLGRETSTDATHKVVERVITWRFENKKQTVITTGFNGDVLEKMYGQPLMDVIRRGFRKLELKTKENEYDEQ